MAKVTVYTTNWCPFCRMAEGLLQQKQVDYERIDVHGDRQTRQWLVGATGGRTTVPQIFINGESIGGFDELSSLDRAGRLDEMLAQPAAG